MEGKKQCLVIGNMNAITYKEVFPLIKDNKLWLGTTDVRWFYQESTDSPLYEAAHSRWFTNIDHGMRHKPLQLMSMADNLKFNKKLKGQTEYYHYDNYDAIEIPYTEVIPSDYEGIMGVPISFLDKYCPEQFEIIGIGLELANMDVIKEKLGKLNGGPRLYVERDGELVRLYERILIRKKQ